MSPSEMLQQGAEHHRAGRMHQAEVLYRRVLALDPSNADAWHLLGLIAHAAGQNEPAVQYLRHALQLAPSRADFLNNLATIHEADGELDLAADCLRAALRLRPDYAAAHHNLGEVCKSLGLLTEAMSSYRIACRCNPALAVAQHSLLNLLNYDPDARLDAVLAEHRRWGERFATPIAPPSHDPNPERRLRIGYVSPDFRKHAVARFFEPLLEFRDRSRFEVVLYAEAPVADTVTTRLRSLADGWRSTWGRSAADVAQQVREDRIDLLIDLAGHTRNNRLDVFALRPAPVQITYLGYPNTTGLTTVDYRISDAILDPPGEPTWTTEEVVRVPGGCWCFRPPDNAPEVKPPPSRSTGRITFGSHHAPIKLSDSTLAVWARVLDAVPDSRLLLFRHSLYPSVERELRRRLERFGVASERVELRRPNADEASYLAVYHDIDVLLDCWPFTGHTLTCEALWMGVPGVTLRGDRHAGRLSASVLTPLGLSDWIAESPEEYIDIARQACGDLDRLTRLRAELRNRIRSTLADGPAFMRRLEEVYRQLWRSRQRDVGLSPAALNDLGNTLRQQGKSADAADCYRRALTLDPGLAAAHANLAAMLTDEGDDEAARRGYREAYRLQPSPRFLMLAETVLPVIYDSVEHLRAAREQFLNGLQRLHEAGVQLDPTREIIPNHFYLAYQGENDRDAHAAIARLASVPDISLASSQSGKVRIGFLSRYLRDHTIGRLNQGLITRLSRDRFEVTLLSLGNADDDLARRLRGTADRFMILPEHPTAARRTVAELGLDVLYYPEIGMDPLTYTLAFNRLAPVQCATWGHPVTSGLPAIDYFLSSVDLETDASEDHYTEKLVRLPRLGVWYERPQPSEPMDRAALGLPERGTLYACPQSLFKFHPEFDDLLGGILRQDPAGVLVLLDGQWPSWTMRLKRRFERTLTDVRDRIWFAPRLGRDRFLALLASVDVLLDPIHFGGGNTSYEGLAVGTPIVTLPSAFLRGRLTAAMYRQMGFLDLITADPAEYVARSVRLGTDRDYRQWTSQQIAERVDVLYNDDTAIREVEQFLFDAVGAALSSPKREY